MVRVCKLGITFSAIVEGSPMPWEPCLTHSHLLGLILWVPDLSALLPDPVERRLEGEGALHPRSKAHCRWGKV